MAIERAQADAAAEVAEAQEAIDRQVAAADELKAAADQAAAEAAAEAASQKAAADRAAAAKAAADRAAAKPAAGKPAAAKPAAPVKAAAAKPAAARRAPARPAAVKPVAAKPDSRGSRAEKAVTPAPARNAAAPRPPRAGAAQQPAKPAPAAAATTPTARPSGVLPSTNDVRIVVAPVGTGAVLSDASVPAGCQPQDLHAGDRVLLTTATGALVHETTLPACQPGVVSPPGTAVAVTSPRFSVTLPKIAWRDGDAWVLQIGAHRWPVTASTLAGHSWSIIVTAQGNVTAGPLG